MSDLLNDYSSAAGAQTFAGTSGVGIRRRIPRSVSSWRSLPSDAPAEFATPVTSAQQSYLDTITAHYSGARPAGQVRWFKSAESATVTLIVRCSCGACDIQQILDGMPAEVDEVLLVGGCFGSAPVGHSGSPDIRTINHLGADRGARGALAAATGDIIVMVDTGGGIDPREIRHLLHFLGNGYDFVKGSRFICGGRSSGHTGLRRVGTRCLLAVFHRMYGIRISDLCYLACAFRRRDLERLGIPNTGSDAGAELTLRAVRSGLRIAEVPMVELSGSKRKPNRRALRDGIRVLRMIVRGRHSERGNRADVSEAA